MPGLRSVVEAEPGRAQDGNFECLVDVHLAIAALSGNPVLALFLEMLMSLLVTRSAAEGERRPDDYAVSMDEAHEDHLGIVEALAAGDAALARLRMVRHLERSRFDERVVAEAGRRVTDA